MNVSDVQVSDKDGDRSGSKTIKANSKIVKEANLDQSSVFSETKVFSLWIPTLARQLHEERVISMRKRKMKIAH